MDAVQELFFPLVAVDAEDEVQEVTKHAYSEPIFTLLSDEQYTKESNCYYSSVLAMMALFSSFSR